MKFSIVIPVYNNEGSIPRLLEVLEELNKNLSGKMEAVFVVDGSPDQSYAILHESLPHISFPAQLLAHSRNFGSFPAIRTGLSAARGDYFAVMAADLQEPSELLLAFFESLNNDECDVAIGTRKRRQDPLFTRMTSGIYWYIYRRFVISEMPEGGVDVFGCNRLFRNQLLKMDEARSSLIALIFWLGFRRKLVSYDRQARHDGVSAWKLSKRIDYMMDSIFAFTDFPIRLLTRIGAAGCIISSVLAVIVLMAKFYGRIDVPGYTATILIVLFLGALNLLGLGLVGTYAWRTYENTKQRPLAIVAVKHTNDDK